MHTYLVNKLLPILTILSCLTISWTANAEPKLNKQDLKALQGEWQIEKAEAGGVEVKQMIGMIHSFKGDRYIMSTNGGPPMVATFKIDSSKTPKQLTHVIIDEVGEKVINNLIYECDGRTLKICGFSVMRPGISKPFPEKMESIKGDRLSYVITFKKVKEKKE